MCLCVFFKMKLLQYSELRETHGFWTAVRAVLLDFCMVFWYNAVSRIGGEYGEGWETEEEERTRH